MTLEELLALLTEVISKKGNIFKGVKLYATKEEYLTDYENGNVETDTFNIVLDEKSTTVYVANSPVDKFNADTKVDVTEEASRIYGTDADGNAKVYKASEVKELIDAVGKKDWATNEVGGVLRGVPYFGFTVDKYGRGQIVRAEQSDIDGKTDSYHPITPALLDYAVMKALSDNKAANIWTDDPVDFVTGVVTGKGTKTKARELIGAVGAGDVTSVTKAGLMMVGEGLIASSSVNGKVNVRKAEKTDIDTATNAYKPIVPLLRDYFTMKALSDCKDATLWTDDTTENGEFVKGTKTKACETIGATKLYLHDISFNQVAIGSIETTSKIRIISQRPTPYSSISLDDFVGGTVASCYVYVEERNMKMWSTVRGFASNGIHLHGTTNTTTALLAFTQIVNIEDVVTAL